ncbi:MAG TPA: hypothetical protein VJ750_13345 [Rhizomicrobium sp.]|nr:hypothetical protein [Rhizomicrobium sp.]
MRAFIFVLMLLPLTACSLFESKELRTLRKSPDYRAGYQDGCNSAWGPGADKRRDDTIVRDDAQYQKNRAYRMGWNRGLNACRSTGYTGGALPGPSNSGPVPDMNPGNGGRPRGL